jgi:Uma2 family endonuclease
VAPDGSETFDQVPLTLRDVLFPKTGDFIVQTDGHDNDVSYLKYVFKARLAGDKTAAVLSDCRVDWNLPGVEPLGPDIAVFLGVRRHRDWATFDVAAEGARPALVVEVTSPDTRQNDVGDKFAFYLQAKVPLYLIADASDRGDERDLELIGYRYTRRGFRPIPPDENGRIYLKPVNLYVGVTRDRLAGYARLACYDPETGEELGDYTAVAKACAAALRQARTAKRQAAAKAKALAAAEARIRELEAQLKNRKKNT